MRLSLEDRADIHELYSSYAHTFDAGDAEGWAMLFASDGVFVLPDGVTIVGSDALTGFAIERAASVPGMRHLIANISLEVTAQAVRGRAYFVCFRLTDDGLFRLRSIGRYEDEFIRGHDLTWRIAVRRVVSELPLAIVDAPFAFALQEGLAPQ